MQQHFDCQYFVHPIVSILSTKNPEFSPKNVDQITDNHVVKLLTIKFGSSASKMTLENCWKTL